MNQIAVTFYWQQEMKARRRFVLLISSILLACPWAPPRGSFHERVIRSSAAGQSNVDLVVKSNSPWQLAWFFAPYTTDSDIDATIGFHCQDCHLAELETRDDLQLLVLVANRQVIKLEELPRSDVDIDSAVLKRPFRPGTRFSIGSRRPVHVGPGVLPPNT